MIILGIFLVCVFISLKYFMYSNPGMDIMEFLLKFVVNGALIIATGGLWAIWLVIKLIRKSRS